MRHDGAVYGARFFPDERRVLSWSNDKTLRFWDVATGKQIGEPMRHDGLIYGALFVPNGRVLSWSLDRTLRLWDLTTGEPIGEPIEYYALWAVRF
jgi:WD40 repeat protein